MTSEGRRRLLGTGLAAVAAPLLLLPAASARTDAKTVRVTITDKAIRLSAKTAPAGKVTFVVRNAGKAKHGFRIGPKKTPPLAAKKTARLVVQFTKAGRYAYGPTLKADAKKKAMKGVFRVTAAPKPKPKPTENLAAGKKVFIDTGCGVCHTLKAAGSNGTIGPNLDTAKISRALIVTRVTKGKGTMPSYAGQLSSKQIQDVADFVFKSRAG